MRSLLLLLALSAGLTQGYVYGRCELARVLYRDYGFQRDTLGDWVCLVQWESSYNTRATNVNTNESIDYGLFMINDYYWCYSSSPYADCKVDCSALINDDIDDDVSCAVLIQSRQGFAAWYGWQNHCKGQDVESYVSDCVL
ncbi:lysozyme c-1 [Hyalella azteca]|uniref:lysozyme n=1 Tax=Hyalella azteca TaxID=294128 RepID=A0A8B7P9T8_HYAAZ|nr:lysozyme c-1 [Hyalella azteca]